MKIRQILKSKGGQVYSISPDSTLKDALSEMLARTIGSLLVLGGDGKLIGILSERDMLRAVYNNGADWAGVRVANVMTREVVTADADKSVDFAMDLMTRYRIRHLPALDGGKLAGVLSIGDIIKASLEEKEFQNEMLNRFIRNWPEEGKSAP